MRQVWCFSLTLHGCPEKLSMYYVRGFTLRSHKGEATCLLSTALREQTDAVPRDLMSQTIVTIISNGVTLQFVFL